MREAAAAGVDGLLALDLPPEESENYEALMRQAGLCVIYLVAPTTPEERIELIVKRATGFVYYVSREGVTGMQAKVSDTIGEMTANSRPHRFAHCRRLWHFHAGAGQSRGGERRRGGGGQRGGQSNRAPRPIAGYGSRVMEFTAALIQAVKGNRPEEVDETSNYVSL